jgi:hypothetical protein
MPISQQALELCGEPKSTKRFVFENLTNPAWINRPLKNGLQKQESIKISLFIASVILLLRCNFQVVLIFTQ